MDERENIRRRREEAARSERRTGGRDDKGASLSRCLRPPRCAAAGRHSTRAVGLRSMKHRQLRCAALGVGSANA